MNDVEPSHFEINEDLHVSADREREDFQTRRRLRKALALAERFKHKYHLEQQVSSELARRCDELKTQRKCDLALVDQLNEEIKKLQTQLRDQLGTCSQSLPTVLPASSTIIATQKPSKNYPDLNTIEILKDCSFDDDLFEDMRRTSITVEDQEQEGEQEQPLEIKNSCKNPIGNTILSPKSSDRTPPPTAASLSSMKVAAKIKSRNSASKLFEHFLVVGASDQAASVLSLLLPMNMKSSNDNDREKERVYSDKKDKDKDKDVLSTDTAEDLKLELKGNLMRRISDMMYPFSTSTSSSPLPGPTVSDFNTATVTANSSPEFSPQGNNFSPPQGNSFSPPQGHGLRLSDDTFSMRSDGGTDMLIQSLRALEIPDESPVYGYGGQGQGQGQGHLKSPLTITREFPSPGSVNSVVSLDPLPLPLPLPLLLPLPLPLPHPLSLPHGPLSLSGDPRPPIVTTANRIQSHLTSIEKSRTHAGGYSVPAEILYRYTDPKGSSSLSSSTVASVAPKDVSDFCLPLGGLLSPLPGSPSKYGTDAETCSSSSAVLNSTTTATAVAAVEKEKGKDKEKDRSPKGRALLRRSYVRHTSKEYTSDCFVFVLDDKTIPPDAVHCNSSSSSSSSSSSCSSSTETDAQHPGKRLYGICVQQMRQITVPFDHTIDPSSPSTDTDDKECSDTKNVPSCMEFESKVCFAFVTHYPFIQFFFQVIHEILAADSASRMIVENEKENKNKNKNEEEGGNERERKRGRSLMFSDNYIPRALLDEMLSRLSGLRAPSYGAHVSFRTNLGTLGKKEIKIRRFCSTLDTLISEQQQQQRHDVLSKVSPLIQSAEEHRWMAASWSLEVLLSPLALSVELLVRVLGLLLCEAKIVVIGSDLCLVSAAIMGLQSLMHPLEWVAPAISILPHKLAEFLECPVPLLAGLVVDVLEPQLQSLRNMSSSNTSTSFYFSSKELQSEFNVGDIDTGGVKCSPGTLKAASLRAAKLLIQCGDGTDTVDSSCEDGMLSAVLDMDEVELYLSGKHSSPENRDQLVMPGAQQLVESLKACLSEAYSSQHVTDEESATDSCELCVLSDRKKERELRTESKIEKKASKSVQHVVAQHIKWLLSLTDKANSVVSSATNETEEGSSLEEYSSPSGTASSRNNHASTFEEVMSLADEEDEVLSQKLNKQQSVSMVKVSPLTAVSEKSRVSEGRNSLPRTASLTQVDSVRSGLRRFLTGNNILPSSGENRSKRGGNGMNAVYKDKDIRGGMSVLLMSQELSMQDNQDAFLKRFTSSQMYAEYVPPVDRTASSAVAVARDASAEKSTVEAVAVGIPASRSTAPQPLTASPPPPPPSSLPLRSIRLDPRT